MGQYKIEKMLQVPEFAELAECLSSITERAGFEPAVLGKEHTGFRNQLDQPLRHLSQLNYLDLTTVEKIISLLPIAVLRRDFN